MKALTFSTFGGPEVLEYREVNDPVLKPGEVLVEMRAIGLNEADILHRKGYFNDGTIPPYITGYEGAGIVVDSNGVEGIYRGDRVAFADVPFACAELVAVPYEHIIPIPENFSCDEAAACLLQGVTAQSLTTDSYCIRNEETVLIHACADVTGQLLTQICKAKDAYVIGLTSSAEKKEIAMALGADEVYLYSEWSEKLAHKNIDVVYDLIGTTLLESIKTVKEGGTVVFCECRAGTSLPVVDLKLLLEGAKTLTGAHMSSYFNSKEERQARSAALFDWMERELISIPSYTSFSLEEGEAAHRFFESKENLGKVILLP